MMRQFKDKTCSDCGTDFSPHSGAQKWCDDCRVIREEAKTQTKVNGTRSFSTKTCEECKETFTPSGGRQKWCDTCRDMAVLNETKIKKCEDCGKQFTPVGRQLRCDRCRFLAMQPKTKDCEGCGKTYLPNSGHQKFCDDCREAREKEQQPQPIVFADIPCRHCGKIFTPNSGAQKQCGECRNDENRCACGSWISGRAKWGEHWGGGCDRAEERVNSLMVAMDTLLSR
jgi:hypothetical protein